ncbi:class I SAM-dependent methyltransferase [Streptococcus dentiloxodontae]
MADSLIDYLIRQSKRPSGLIGGIMTRIWSIYFRGLSTWTLKQIDNPNNLTILDVGFGGGANLKQLAKQPQVKLFGIDVSAQAFKQTRKRLQKEISAGIVYLQLGDVSALPFPDQTFDLIIATQTHIYWDNLELGLAECRRVLKKGGRLLITSEKSMISYHLPTYKDPAVFLHLLRQIGYRQIQIRSNEVYLGFICEK